MCIYKSAKTRYTKPVELSHNACSRIGRHISSKTVHHKIYYRRQYLQKGIPRCRVGTWQALWQGALKTWVGLTLMVKSHGKWQNSDSFRERTWRGLEILNLRWGLVDRGISGTLKMWKGVGCTFCVSDMLSVLDIQLLFHGNWRKSFSFVLVLFC